MLLRGQVKSFKTMIAIYTSSGTAEHLYNNQQHVLTVHVNVSQLWDNYKHLQVMS